MSPTFQTRSILAAHRYINDLDNLLCPLITKYALTQDQSKEKYDK